MKNTSLPQTDPNPRRKTLKPPSQYSQPLQAYLSLMQKLLDKLEVSKIRKITKQIKKQNIPFREYLNQNRIVAVKYEDVVRFEEWVEKGERWDRDRGDRGERGEGGDGRRSGVEQVRNGFWKLKAKMEEYQVIDFQMQMRYCNSTIVREVDKLDKLGYEYEGINFIRNSQFHSEQLQQDQIENGRYQLLRANQLKKSNILETFQLQFKKVLLKNDD